MKFKLSLFTASLLILLTLVQTAKTQTTGNTKSHIPETPHRIMLTIPGDPATSRAVTWRTNASVTNGTGQITEAAHYPYFTKDAVNVSATTTEWETGNPSATGHKVVFENLKPNTTYTYRVGNGDQWSEWFQFTTTCAKNKSFNFLYLGDFQNDIKQHCSRLIRQAYTHFPEAEFILMAGDLVNRSTEEYWDEFFYAGDWIFATKPVMATPGNHEYTSVNDVRVFSNHWNQIFANPDNGPEGLKNNSFFIDYQGVRFVSFDSPGAGYSEKNTKNTILWLDKVLSESTGKWTVVFTHYPVYSCSQGRDNDEYREMVKPLLEKYGVDLVLTGHDHSYCRGQNLSGVGSDCKNPPMYMVSMSGPKMYGLNVNRWSDRVASMTQLYQNVKVNGDTLSVEAYTVNGHLYDSFSLIKQQNGVNKVVESPLIQDLQENTEIPPNAADRYSEEEMKLYNERFRK